MVGGRGKFSVVKIVLAAENSGQHKVLNWRKLWIILISLEPHVAFRLINKESDCLDGLYMGEAGLHARIYMRFNLAEDAIFLVHKCP